MKKHLVLLLLTGVFNMSAEAQGWQPTPNDTLKSVRISGPDQIQLSVFAPDAKKVTLSSPDFPDMGMGKPMEKLASGVWQILIRQIPPGAYRYQFLIDGVSVLDPKNTQISESNTNNWSLCYLPGDFIQEIGQVAHGSVSEVTYFSESLKKNRRLHVYLPPGYESDSKTYPVLFLLHGAMDCDDSWTTVGRAGFILDNLIATGKAVPMVVIMPAGHTGTFSWGMPINREVDEFYEDFTRDILPLAAKSYRISTDQKDRAIAGLSMGGAQTIKIAVNHPGSFSAFGVFSSGVFGIAGGMGTPPSDEFEKTNQKNLAAAESNPGLKLVWFATGKDDFLLETSRKTVDLFRKYHYPVTYKETSGGHTWLNWRNYLAEFAPLLFR